MSKKKGINYSGGGGATDIRIEGNTLYHRILVAGGGGSGPRCDGSCGASNIENAVAGSGGGIEGTSSNVVEGYGATQTSAGGNGGFGYGESARNANDCGGIDGSGGGGWYGGGAGNHSLLCFDGGAGRRPHFAYCPIVQWHGGDYAERQNCKLSPVGQHNNRRR